MNGVAVATASLQTPVISSERSDERSYQVANRRYVRGLSA